MKGSGSFLGDKWMRQSVTKNWVALINAVAVSEHQAWLAHQSHENTRNWWHFQQKKKKKSPIFILPPSSLTLPHTQHWPFNPKWVTLNGEESFENNSLFVFCCFSGNTKGLTRPFICRFFKRKRKKGEPTWCFLSLSFFFFMRRSLCLQSLYLPFISGSLALLVGRVSGRQSLSLSLWCFCRLQRAFEATALLIATASDRPMPSVRLTAK